MKYLYWIPVFFYLLALVALIYSNIELRKVIKLSRPRPNDDEGTKSPRILEMQQIVKEMEDAVTMWEKEGQTLQ